MLELDLEYNTAGYITKMISLSHLTDLTPHDTFSLLRDDPYKPLLQGCRSLRRLHIDTLSSVDHLCHFFQFTPALTHLCFSHLQRDVEFPLDLEVALGLAEPDLWQLKVARLPHTIHKILLTPDVIPDVKDNLVLEHDERTTESCYCVLSQECMILTHQLTNNWPGSVNGGAEMTWSMGKGQSSAIEGRLFHYQRARLTLS